MPSIFVWKASNPISSSSIRYYSGSNWFLEEHPSHSMSYLYCQQQTLSQGMAFDAICMPQNWVGSEIMEIMEVPYQQIRDDADGILEQLGGWMRYRMKRDIPFELDILEYDVFCKQKYFYQQQVMLYKHELPLAFHLHR